jgi:hypothetical protein
MPRLAELPACLQRRRVSETMDSARRWRALVCPDCRFVFRVPKDHEGTGVVCPSCRRLLRIPGAGDDSPPLVVQAEQPGLENAKGERRRRRKRKKIADDMPWEEESGEERTGKKWGQRMGWQLAAGVMILAVLVVWLSLTMQQQPEPEPVLSPGVPDMTGIVVPEVPEAPELWYDKDQVQELCRAFLAATSVEEMLPMIRDAGRLEPEIRRHHAGGKVDKMELAGFGIMRESTVGQWRALTLQVQTRSFMRRFLNVCETADGLRVDWESWVGHSSMPWEEMMEKKPTDPVLVRVLLSYVDYYNMDFSDDQKWSSCRMLSRNHESIHIRQGAGVESRSAGLWHLRRDRRGAGNRQLVLPRFRRRRPRGQDDLRL